MPEDTSEYRITITRKVKGGQVTIDWGGYALLHELLTDIMYRAAQSGWLTDWPELPNPQLLKSKLWDDREPPGFPGR